MLRVQTVRVYYDTSKRVDVQFDVLDKQGRPVLAGDKQFTLSDQMAAALLSEVENLLSASVADTTDQERAHSLVKDLKRLDSISSEIQSAKAELEAVREELMQAAETRWQREAEDRAAQY